MKPHILIEVKNGTVTAVYATEAIDISIIDHDCKDEPEKLTNIYEADGICPQKEISDQVENAYNEFTKTLKTEGE